MFYKKDENNNWFVGNKIHFPDGTDLSVDNKVEKNGWKWHDTPPAEYTEWLNQQEEEQENI